MRSLLAGTSSLVALALLAAFDASGARADDGVTYVRLSITGACPDRAAVRDELQTLVRIAPRARPDAWTLTVEGRDGRTQFRLDGPTGDDRGIERELPSRDCAALAGVIARIVERHLSSLNLPVGGLEPPPPLGTLRSGPDSARADPSRGARPDPRWALRVVVGAGARVEVGPGVVQAVPQVGVTLGHVDGWRAGLALDLLAPWRLRGADEEADLVGAGLRAHGGYELTLRSGVRLVPFALLRLGLVWVSAEDLPGADQLTRLLGELGVGSELAWEAYPGVELWVAAEARAPLNVARYRIEPAGQVGTSAFAVLEVSLGVALRTNP